MSLIKCPECQRQVSDKAVSCPNCGFPISSVVRDIVIDQEVENTEVIKINFRNGYTILYSDKIFNIFRDNISIYKGETTTIKLYGFAKSIFDNGYIQLYVPKSDIPRELKCLELSDYEKCIEMVRDYKANIEKNYKVVTMKKLCPQCGGTNYHAFINEVVIQEGKVKSRTTVNLNPLRPVTVFNHTEKVVRKPLTKQISKFVCDDCGKIFQ